MTEHRINLDALAKDRGTHSSFGPSSSAMWLNCPGSLIPNLMAEDDAGEDAAYGTVGHMVTETWLRTSKKPTHLLGEVEWVEAGDWGFLIPIDEVMLEHARSCVEWVEFLPGEQFVEQRVYFSQITPIPNQGGTADFMALEPGRMVIADWKFGKGVQVYAENNTQGLLYALGAFYEWDHIYRFEEIELRIGQPRLDHWDTWVVTRKQLLEFAEWARPRAHAAWKLNAPRVPGPKQCQWCKVKRTCAAAAKVYIDLTSGVFADLIEPVSAEDVQDFKEVVAIGLQPPRADLMSLTTAEMARLLTWRKTIESWWSDLAEEVERRAKRGENVPHWKLVEARSNRIFRYPQEAAMRLLHLGVPEDEVFKTSICSPAQAEELLCKVGRRRKDIPHLLEGYVYKPPGKPTLAPEHDKRPALVDTSAEVFADVIENCEI